MDVIYEIIAWIVFYAVIDNFTSIDLDINNNTQETLIFICATATLGTVISWLK